MSIDITQLTTKQKTPVIEKLKRESFWAPGRLSNYIVTGSNTGLEEVVESVRQKIEKALLEKVIDKFPLLKDLLSPECKLYYYNAHYTSFHKYPESYPYLRKLVNGPDLPNFESQLPIEYQKELKESTWSNPSDFIEVFRKCKIIDENFYELLEECEDEIRSVCKKLDEIHGLLYRCKTWKQVLAYIPEDKVLNYLSIYDSDIILSYLEDLSLDEELKKLDQIFITK